MQLKIVIFVSHQLKTGLTTTQSKTRKKRGAICVKQQYKGANCLILFEVEGKQDHDLWRWIPPVLPWYRQEAKQIRCNLELRVCEYH